MSLVLSLKLPSFTWMGALVPQEQLNGIVKYIYLEKEPRSCFNYYTIVS